MSVIESLIDKLASASVEEVEKENEISFAGRGLKLDREEDAEEIVHAISNCMGMTTLRMEGNTMGIPAAKVIAKVLENQPKFKRALFKDMFTRRTENEIPQALGFLSSGIMTARANLVELDLSDNAFGPRGLKGIVDLLQSPSCYSLKELHLNNNGLGISGGKMLAETLCSCVANSKRDGKPLNLKVFVCGRNRLENEGATAISKFFKAVGTLESIAMPQNGIYHDGVKQLSEAFASNPGLKNINLEDNTLTEEGVKHIAKCMPTLKHLEFINFGDCLIGTKGAMILAKALEDHCPGLREIYLGYNEIKKEGGNAIVKAMKNKKLLEKLVLNGNQFGEEGCHLIQKVMSEMDKSEQLGTLSDDDDEADEEGDEEEDDEEEEEEEEDLSEDEIIDVTHIGHGDQPSPKHRSPMFKLTPEDFMSNPTAEKLVDLEKSGANFISLLPENPSISCYLDLFVNICSVVKPGDENAKSAAIKYADEILEKAFKLSGTDYGSQFNNDFVVSLGLLKGEDKKIKTVIDVSGALVVLEHCVRQPYFNSATKNLLQFFLSRPLLYVTACNKAKHSLLQTLYQI